MRGRASCTSPHCFCVTGIRSFQVVVGLPCVPALVLTSRAKALRIRQASSRRVLVFSPPPHDRDGAPRLTLRSAPSSWLALDGRPSCVASSRREHRRSHLPPLPHLPLRKVPADQRLRLVRKARIPPHALRK